MADDGYDNLTPTQQAEFDRLMTQPTRQWPPGLVAFVRDSSGDGPFRGVAFARAVSRWVSAPVPDEEETVAAAALEPPGPGVRCHGCGALPDEQHGENCRRSEAGDAWDGETHRGNL